jgi:hypothetical protein
VAHRLEIKWLAGQRCGGSLVKDLVAHGLEIHGSLVGNELTH